MKNVIIILMLVLPFVSNSQNVGIGTTNPTNSLHIIPATSSSPLRIEGLKPFIPNQDSTILIVDPNSGVVRYINENQLANLVFDTLYSLTRDSLLGDSVFSSTIDSIILRDTNFTNGLVDTLLANIYFKDSIYTFVKDSLLDDTTWLSELKDSIDTDITSANLVGTTLNIFEDNSVVSVNLNSIRGDITQVNAGLGLTGGGASGLVTLNAAANNGISVNSAADRIQLGGSLIKNTTINQANYTFTHFLNGNGDFLVRTNSNSNLFRVDASTNRIGIGTSVPSATLDVNGNTRLRNVPTTTSTSVQNLVVDASGNVRKQNTNIGFGPKFISPRTIVSTTGTRGWTTINTSSYIPTGATAVIVEYEYVISDPDGGDVDAHVRIRRNSSSSSYIVTRGRSSGGGDNVSGGGQGVYPLNTNRTFQYTIERPGFNGAVTLRVVGYY